ncbi:hypothetical protein PVL29_012842 [Vitis rotundifolia]|uniref:Tubulin--tyrosine ligase-like protein 12 SET-like domain-containing protein n=1 Tax=Vitis rotundifolia TaxID=103349 RepID=A0AA38ZKA6_VITRO|nr:hypothetical protein PVL29_012842 [Vitis rotundifolia]
MRERTAEAACAHLRLHGKESHVFLIDHAWTFRLFDAPKQLQEVPRLAERMASLICVDIDMDSNSEETDTINRGSDEKDTKLDAMRMLRKRVRKVVLQRRRSICVASNAIE